jgi:hypothetical protein
MSQKQARIDSTANEVRIPIESNEHLIELFTRSIAAISYDKLKKLSEKYPLPGVMLALKTLASDTEIHSASLERRNLRLIAKHGYDINQYEALRLEPRAKGVGFDLVLSRITEADAIDAPEGGAA